MSFSVKDIGQLKWCLAKPRHDFAYHRLDKVKIKKKNNAKFDPNVPCGSKVMNISLTDHNSLKYCSAYPRPSIKDVHGKNVDMHLYAKFDQIIYFYHDL